VTRDGAPSLDCLSRVVVPACGRAQQQAELHEQQRLEAFLLPEDNEWLRMWT